MSTVSFRLSKAIESTSRPPFVRYYSRPAVTILIEARLPRIPQAYQWSEAYKATPERPLLDMSQGVPGIPPPKSLLTALAEASSDPNSCGYVPNAGEPSLRDAVVEEMQISYGPEADVSREDVSITAGCNLAFAAAVMTVASKGDEIIIPVPWYFNHE